MGQLLGVETAGGACWANNTEIRKRAMNFFEYPTLSKRTKNAMRLKNAKISFS